MRLDPEAIHARIAQLLKERMRFVVATIIEIKGSCPQQPGARMIVHHDGKFEFTIGGGTFEAEVIRDALAAFAQQTLLQREYRLTKAELGMYCQGRIRVLFESYGPRPQLVIFGGGHVGQALSKLASASDLFSVTVIDDREEYADPAKHPTADRVILTGRNFEEGVPKIDSDTYIVIVTRCHATDQLLVKRYIDKEMAYLGLIGSKAKIRQFLVELQEEGISSSQLEKLHAPIGLPIGGKSPAEVAVSILAELIQIKNSKASSSHWTEFQVSDQRK